ncbi:dihydroorotase [Parahalioglobus pacificus]|uniref:Dihydroorotase n=1 Tax=Parahalioglobus pacificus TaxID=930806 RepID=A0A918XDF6_9GAMM|nr:dihydroorotase [Halioglobus pacificus]GHD27563.1 dihydroorotase [Halioglobus pacificus]
MSQSEPSTLIKNARIVNEGSIVEGDLRIEGQRIAAIANELSAGVHEDIIDAAGCWLLPGFIDDQVHFREPGLTYKGSIATESRAAVAGGITSFMEMPNVDPATTSIEALESKFDLAAQRSMGNYSFYLGATEDNLDQIKRMNPKRHCGVKVFMGASTGDLLVENPNALEAIFREAPSLIVTHCESGPVMAANRDRILETKDQLTINDHPVLRDTAACYASSEYAVGLAKKHGSQLHVLHITTAKELELFAPGPIENKSITAEACVHHLWFTADDYDRLGNLIKCNPAIKYQSDRDAIIEALKSGRIDIIATDHAPHTLDEKEQPYSNAPAGLPLVQHALLTLLDHVNAGRMSPALVVEKTAHAPAKRYNISERGFIREGYFADLVMVDPGAAHRVTADNIRYKCGWSPYTGHTFTASIKSTWVNGARVFDGNEIIESARSPMAMVFDR